MKEQLSEDEIQTTYKVLETLREGIFLHSDRMSLNEAHYVIQKYENQELQKPENIKLYVEEPAYLRAVYKPFDEKPIKKEAKDKIEGMKEYYWITTNDSDKYLVIHDFSEAENIMDNLAKEEPDTINSLEEATEEYSGAYLVDSKDEVFQGE